MSEPPAWTAPYVGLPYGDGGRGDEPDCYGLGRRVMLELCGIDLPLYDCYEHARSSTVPLLIRSALREADTPWREVPWEHRMPFDWVVYLVGDLPAHLGVVADRDWGLVTFRDFGSGCEEFWRAAHRIEATALGCYRHREVAA